MTLILSALSVRYAIQVSDRRLSSNGRLIDDDSSKLSILQCNDGRFAAGYTGLAQLGTFNTQRWLARALLDSAPPHFTAWELFNRFTTHATETFASHPALRTAAPADKRLTIMFSGFLNRDGFAIPVMALMTNFQNFELGSDDNEAWPSFRSYYREPTAPKKPPTDVQRVGAYAAFGVENCSTIRAMLDEDKPPHAVVEKAVELMREASDSALAGGTVGKRLMSIIIPANFAEAATSNYHSDVNAHTSYLADAIDARESSGAILHGFKIEAVDKAGPPLVVPKQGRNRPCGCGSGAKYKRCHGRN